MGSLLQVLMHTWRLCHNMKTKHEVAAVCEATSTRACVELCFLSNCMYAVMLQRVRMLQTHYSAQ
jgi:hypothetical protein